MAQPYIDRTPTEAAALRQSLIALVLAVFAAGNLLLLATIGSADGWFLVLKVSGATGIVAVLVGAAADGNAPHERAKLAMCVGAASVVVALFIAVCAFLFLTSLDPIGGLD